MGTLPAPACRCCGAVDLVRVLDLGRQPLANSYTPRPTALPTYPLELFACRACSHAQLGVVVDPDAMFRHYLYVSGTSRTLRAHFAGLAGEAIGWAGRQPTRVLDLACNDGTLLAAFRAAGCEVAGVDPAENLVATARAAGLAVTAGYWPAAGAAVAGRFDVITACNVLAHVADPRAFLAAALDRLTPGGLVVLEFPYAREMLERCEWDTIYHEHLSYFLAAPFRRLVDGIGASVAHARQISIHGGSLRLAVRPGGGGHCPEFLGLAAREERDGLLGLEAYRRFAAEADETCRRLAALAVTPDVARRTLVGYGASAKGNTLLNRCPLPLAWIADDNPLKHGYWTPGLGVPIRPPADLAAEPGDVCLVLLAWNFADEILANVRRLRPGRADLALHYVPAPRLEPV